MPMKNFSVAHPSSRILADLILDSDHNDVTEVRWWL